MGGRDRSDLEIQEERAERLRLERQLESLQSQAVDFQNALANSLKSSTAGIRATFSSESREAERWLERAAAVAATGQAGSLRARHADLTTLVREGETQLRQLLFCFSQRGDEIAGDLAEQLVSVRSLLVKHQTECSKWFAAEVGEWRRDVERASQLQDDEHYQQAASLLDAVEQSIGRCRAKSLELAKQQQSRNYLLKAVRQVCCNMGMQEIEPPRLEHPGEAGSRILLTVASPDKGKLRFALSLDGIQSLGEASECTQDLRQFSELLSNGFDIRTKFGVLADDDPQLRTAGVRALPDAVDRSMHGQG